MFGAGAIGGFLAARLARGRLPVSVVARGPHLAAMQADGLALESERRAPSRPNPASPPTRPRSGRRTTCSSPSRRTRCSRRCRKCAPLIGPETTIVAGVNGLPWWYFYGLAGPFRDRRIARVDPDGALWDGLPPAQTLGCIVYPAAEIAAPGVIRHTFGDRFSLGEPDGSRSARAERLCRKC